MSTINPRTNPAGKRITGLRTGLTATVACVLLGTGIAVGAGQADAAGRHTVTADVDAGGGVILANRPGGYYMGRLLPGRTFDRQGGWYSSPENRSSYAWGTAYGHSNGCLWIGPSRGKFDFTAGKWAAGAGSGGVDRCTDAQRDWLAADDGANVGSHFNCPPPSSAAHGTEKPLLADATLYWNIDWAGGYEGGALADPVATIPAGTHVWYRYTTRGGGAIVAWVPGYGWGFLPVGALDRSQTGYWSTPEDPASRQPC